MHRVSTHPASQRIGRPISPLRCGRTEVASERSRDFPRDRLTAGRGVDKSLARTSARTVPIATWKPPARAALLQDDSIASVGDVISRAADDSCSVLGRTSPSGAVASRGWAGSNATHRTPVEASEMYSMTRTLPLRKRSGHVPREGTCRRSQVGLPTRRKTSRCRQFHALRTTRCGNRLST